MHLNMCCGAAWRCCCWLRFLRSGKSAYPKLNIFLYISSELLKYSSLGPFRMFDLNFPFVLCFKQWQRKGSVSNLSTDFKWDHAHNTQVIHSFTICKLVNCLFIPQLIRSTYNLRDFQFPLWRYSKMSQRPEGSQQILGQREICFWDIWPHLLQSVKVLTTQSFWFS